MFFINRRNKNYKSKPVLPKVQFSTFVAYLNRRQKFQHYDVKPAVVTLRLQHLLNVKSLKYLSNLTLPDRITKSLLHLHKKKKPPSISAQFQVTHTHTRAHSQQYSAQCWPLSRNFPPAANMIKNKTKKKQGVSVLAGSLMHLLSSVLSPCICSNLCGVYQVVHTPTQTS